MTATEPTLAPTLTSTETPSVNFLMDGFLPDRNLEGGFVLHNETATGWDLGRKSYASFIYGKEEPKNDIDALKLAYQLCKNRVSVLKKEGQAVHFTFDDVRSCTDGKMVFVATEVMDAKGYSYEQKIDVVLGLTTHEMGHVLYTNFDLKKIASEEKLFHTIENILEDERLERAVSNDTPGYSRQLKATKQYYFDFKYTLDKEQEEGEEKIALGDFKEIFDCFFKMVRFPQYLTEVIVAKHAEALTEIKEILTPYPVKYPQILEASHKVYAILSRYAKKEADKQNKIEKKGSGAEGDGKGEEGEGQVKEITAKDIMDAIANALKDLKSRLEQKRKGEQEEEEESDDDGNGDAVSEVAQVLLESSLNLAKIEGRVEEGELKVITGNGDLASVFFVKSEEDKGSYEQYRKEVHTASKGLASILKMEHHSSAQPIRSLRQGNFDETKIVEAYLGQEAVYSRTPTQESKAMPVVLFIDQSGSMSYRNKISDASKVAITFIEALKGLKATELYIYGFTSDVDADDHHEITIFKENNYSKEMNVGSIKARECNADGVCIREVCKRVRKFNSNKALLFVISDGEPSSYFYRTENEGIQDTAQAVILAEKMGFTPIQIGIGVNVEKQSMMFKNYVNYTTGKEMVQKIGNVLRNALKKAR